MESKVAVPSSKPSIGKASQPLVGKIGKDMGAMPGSKGKGQAVKTVPSNPITGKPKTGTSMGSGSTINGFV